MYSLSQLSYLRAIQSRAEEQIRHRPRLEFVDWAPKYIENPDGTPFRFRPTQVQIAKDLFNPTLPTVAVRAYSGAGKTYLYAAGFCYAIEQLRIAAACMFPSQNIAEDWVNEELMKLFESTPVMDRLNYQTDLKRMKRWREGGELYALGANSSGLIRRLQATVLFADEIDAIEQTSTDEGDKLKQFWKRGRGRKVQHKWASSYPSRKGHSKIDGLYDQSDRCRWIVNCLRCGHAYEMHTRQMDWKPKHPDTARIVCPECGKKHDEEARRKMAESGEYLNKNLLPPEDGVNRGFHLGCMAHTGDHNNAFDGYLHEVAAEIEANRTADNPEKARRVFVNTMDAESFADAVETKPEADTLYNLREKWNPLEMLPWGVCCLTLGVDVQKDRLELMLVGWGENAESWLVTYRILYGSPLNEEVWNKLDKFRALGWKHPAGPTLYPKVTFVDSGKWQEAILDYTRPRLRGGVYACKGAKQIDRKLMDGKPTRVGRPVTLQYHIGTHEAKDIIYQRLELTPPKEPGQPYPRGYIHVPENEEFGPNAGAEGSGFFEMLTAEDSTMKRSAQTGEFIRFFDNPRNTRNEPLDLFVYAMAAERVLNPDYEHIQRKFREGVGEK